MKTRIFSPATIIVTLTIILLASCGRSATPTPRPTRTRLPSATPTAIATETPVPQPTDVPTRVPTPQGLPVQASLGDTWLRPADEMMLVYVPGGDFLMGVAQDDPLVQSDEIPPHLVTLGGFWIDQTEVSNAQYARCVAAGACNPPFSAILERHQDYYDNPEYDAYPVLHVNWMHGHNYCTWVGGALPSEAQWEYTARGPQSSTYPWGNNPPDDTLLNYDKNLGDTAPVGSYPAGASWCGALDMAGNVHEWTNDWFRSYSAAAQTDPAGAESGIGHVLRGGSWYDNYKFVRGANRYVISEAYQDYTVPSGHGFNIGFRCVVTP